MKSKHEPWCCCLERNPERDRGPGSALPWHRDTCWCSRALGPHPEQQQPPQSSGARCLHGRGVSSPSGDAPARGCPRAGVAWLGCCSWLRQCSPMDSAPLAHSPGIRSPGAPSPHQGFCGPPWPVTARVTASPSAPTRERRSADPAAAPSRSAAQGPQQPPPGGTGRGRAWKQRRGCSGGSGSNGWSPYEYGAVRSR